MDITKEFVGWPKIPRWSRDIIITEKLDGTNAAVCINDNGTEVWAQSRSRIITPDDDNYGFAGWVERNRDALIQELGPGRHFGEWWGQGINRNYGLKEKRFSLFNVTRWRDSPLTVCSIVPVLYEGMMYGPAIDGALEDLRCFGSRAALGFMNPEGIVVFHTAANTCFKKTIEKDDEWKGKAKEAA